MSTANLELADLIKFMEKSLGVKPGVLTASSRRGDLPQWDSLGHVMFVESLSKEYNVKITADEALQMLSVADVLKILQSK